MGRDPFHQTRVLRAPSNLALNPAREEAATASLGKPIPVPDHFFSKEIFPNIQSKPPLAQLQAIAFCPIASYLGEETNTCLTTTSFQVVVESDKVSPQPPLLQTKPPQLLPTGLTSCIYLHCSTKADACVAPSAILFVA